MFSLPKTFSLGSVREHTPYFVVHLARALGKVFKPGNNRAGEENQRYRRIFTSEYIWILSICLSSREGKDLGIDQFFNLKGVYKKCPILNLVYI